MVTLSDLKRICTAHKHCVDCPMFLGSGYGCSLHIPQNWDMSEVYRKAEQWLKENPEPIYPSYYDWLIIEGVTNFNEKISPEFAKRHNVNPL